MYSDGRLLAYERVDVNLTGSVIQFGRKLRRGTWNYDGTLGPQAFMLLGNKAPPSWMFKSPCQISIHVSIGSFHHKNSMFGKISGSKLLKVFSMPNYLLPRQLCIGIKFGVAPDLYNLVFIVFDRFELNKTKKFKNDTENYYRSKSMLLQENYRQLYSRYFLAK